MALLIAMEANQIRSLDDNRSSTIATKVPRLSALIAARTTRPVGSIMSLSALAIATST